MKSTQVLNRETAKVAGAPAERILQFGGGNFLRAFVDWMIDILNKETEFSGSVVIVKPTERGDYKNIDAQDGLYHVVLDGIIDGRQQSKTYRIDCISRTIQPYREWEDFLATARQEEIRYIVSNTTEAGIVFRESDQKSDQPPAEFPGKLVLWLYERFRFFEGAADKGCYIIPCELIEDNGDRLQEVLLQYADHFGLEQTFKDWLTESNHFYNTLVDRIVSGYPAARAEAIEETTGFKDPLLVAGEYYHSFVLSGDPSLLEEWPFPETGLNVRLVDRISDYRELKVRILNGAHTSLVPVAYLAGKNTVDEAMAESALKDFVLQLLDGEVKPTLTTIPESEIEEFINAVADRFSNKVLAHKLLDISLNSISKFKSRLLPTLLDHIEINGRPPVRILFAVAALILFYRGERNGEAIPLRDDAENIDFAKKTWAEFDRGTLTNEEFVLRWLDRVGITEDRAIDRNNLLKIVTENLERIRKKGILKALP